MSGQIEVRTWLSVETWHAFATIADKRGTSVSQLLAQLADQALAPARQHRQKRVKTDRPRREYRKWTAEDSNRAIALHASGLSDSAIAQELDRAQPVVSKKLRDLGLAAHHAAPPTRRAS